MDKYMLYQVKDGEQTRDTDMCRTACFKNLD